MDKQKQKEKPEGQGESSSPLPTRHHFLRCPKTGRFIKASNQHDEKLMFSSSARGLNAGRTSTSATSAKISDATASRQLIYDQESTTSPFTERLCAICLKPLHGNVTCPTQTWQTMVIFISHAIIIIAMVILLMAIVLMAIVVQ